MNEATYNVVLDRDTPYANDLGEMTETKLFAYLNDRHLVGPAPQEVLDALEEKGALEVEFETIGKRTQVKIQRVSTASA